MAYISSIGLGVPNYRFSQKNVKKLVKDIFPLPDRLINKYLPIFDHAQIHERQLVVDEEWLSEYHTFEEKNILYKKLAIQYSLKATDNCLSNKHFLKKGVPYEAIDMIVFISSTGITTPSLEAYLMNERPFRENIVRMPLWGLGCAGGAIGLSRAADWIAAHKDKIALVICCELCSLTFQKDDKKVSNLVGTALFGDGISAALLMGENSKYLSNKQGVTPVISKQSSFTKKNTDSIMGWNVTNNGLEVVFSKRIPKLVKTLWKEHLDTFLQEIKINEEQIHSFIAHPGGIKVLKAMESLLSDAYKKLYYSYEVLGNHGNMSSATVFYVLNEWMRQSVPQKEYSILSALGPGFSSELLLLEWN